MSSEIAIKVENLSKCYHIYDKPRDRLAQMFFWGRKKFYREFWALKDVSFEIKKGETVGIIGRNGSGKSTLLQLICGTLAQTSGTISTQGRVAALLELGSGFNPEFTGRENVYMNASILGLSPEEIDSRFADIATFADIGEYIDQPVKTYSSGMYVRLAFAVIAHVDADILVIDEALAVGDAVFTQKCMRYIRDFRKRGTLLFVSHDMNSVLNLCEKAVWLDHGQVRRKDEAKTIAEEYLQFTLQSVYEGVTELESIKNSDASEKVENDTYPPKNKAKPLDAYDSHFEISENIDKAKGWEDGGGKIRRVQLQLEDGSVPAVFRGGEMVRMVAEADISIDMANPILGFIFRDRMGQDLFGENTLPFNIGGATFVKAGGGICAEFVFQLPMLPNGDYAVMASLASGDLYNNIQHHFLHDALIVHVSNSRIRWGLVGVPFYDVKLDVKS